SRRPARRPEHLEGLLAAGRAAGRLELPGGALQGDAARRHRGLRAKDAISRKPAVTALSTTPRSTRPMAAVAAPATAAGGTGQRPASIQATRHTRSKPSRKAAIRLKK